MQLMYREYIQNLRATCKEKNFSIKIVDRVENFPIYRIDINKKGKLTICITAGIHGDEPSGPFGILKFLKIYKPVASDPKLIIIPVVNPFGFDQNKHSGAEGVNLNRHFFDKSLPKSIRKLYYDLKKEKIDFFVSLHEDGKKRSFYIYEYSRKENDIFEKIIYFISKRWPITRGKYIHRNPAERGIIYKPRSDSSFEERMFEDGVPFATCIEVPDYISFKARVQELSRVLKLIIKHFSV